MSRCGAFSVPTNRGEARPGLQEVRAGGRPLTEKAEESAIRRLFERHYPVLVRYLFHRLGDADLAEDLAQEAFVRLLDHRPRRPLAWLYAVARNLATDALRDRTRRRRGLRALAAEGPAPPPDPEEAMARRREAGRVEAALRALSERDRTLLLLRAEGLRYRQLAEILGVATTSIGPLLTRSQRRFLRAYREAAGSEGEEGLASA